jgi:hypothetical protein
MNKKILAIVPAVVFGLVVLNSSILGQEGTANTVVAKAITQEEAAKKYPPGPKGYLSGQPQFTRSATASGGFYKSPYSNKIYDCREIKSGQLVLDTYARPPQVFIKP